MATPTEYHQCSERVGYSTSSYRGRPCSKPATIRREMTETKYEERTFTNWDEYGLLETKEKVPVQVEVPKWFCGTHDPYAVSARQAKKAAEDRAEREGANRRYTDIEARGKALIARLGTGSQHYYTDPYARGGGARSSIQPSLTLSFEALEKLLAELGR